MTRAFAPAIGADRYADISDEDEADRYADEIDARNLIVTPEWWLTRMSEQISYGEADRIATCLARCLREIDRACKGDRYAQIAITTALSILQASAIKDASHE